MEDEFSAVRMQGDSDLIARAVRNLIHNSIRHNPQGCEIVVEGKVSVQGDNSKQRDDSQQEIRVAVYDTGKGVPQPVIDALADMDAQILYDEQKPHIMGLRIVKQIVSAHGGSFEITENGHRVILIFPVIPIL